MNNLGKNLYEEIYIKNDKCGMYLIRKFGADSKARTTKNGYVGMLFTQKISRRFRRQFKSIEAFCGTVLEELN